MRNDWLKLLLLVSSILSIVPALMWHNAITSMISLVSFVVSMYTVQILMRRHIKDIEKNIADDVFDNDTNHEKDYR